MGRNPFQPRASPIRQGQGAAGSRSRAPGAPARLGGACGRPLLWGGDEGRGGDAGRGCGAGRGGVDRGFLFLPRCRTARLWQRGRDVGSGPCAAPAPSPAAAAGAARGGAAGAGRAGRAHHGLRQRLRAPAGSPTPPPRLHGVCGLPVPRRGRGAAAAAGGGRRWPVARPAARCDPRPRRARRQGAGAQPPARAR